MTFKKSKGIKSCLKIYFYLHKQTITDILTDGIADKSKHSLIKTFAFDNNQLLI